MSCYLPYSIIFGLRPDVIRDFDVLLTVLHLSIFISVFYQIDAQNLFHNKFYFMSLHVSSTCAHHGEVKIALHSLWYHHTYRWPSRLFYNKFISCLYMFRAHVLIIRRSKLHFTASGIVTPIGGRLVCFTISLFHASTCFEHMCSSSGGQNCISQPLVSSHL